MIEAAPPFVNKGRDGFLGLGCWLEDSCPEIRSPDDCHGKKPCYVRFGELQKEGSARYGVVGRRN